MTEWAVQQRDEIRVAINELLAIELKVGGQSITLQQDAIPDVQRLLARALGYLEELDREADQGLAWNGGREQLRAQFAAFLARRDQALSQ